MYAQYFCWNGNIITQCAKNLINVCETWARNYEQLIYVIFYILLNGTSMLANNENQGRNVLISKCPIDNNPAFGIDNGLTPNRRQAIISTNADLIHWRIYAVLGGDELNLRKSTNVVRYIYSYADDITWVSRRPQSQESRLCDQQLMQAAKSNLQSSAMLSPCVGIPNG